MITGIRQERGAAVRSITERLRRIPERELAALRGDNGSVERGQGRDNGFDNGFDNQFDNSFDNSVWRGDG